MNQQIWIWIHFICTMLRWVSNHPPSLYPLFNLSTHHFIHDQPSTYPFVYHPFHPFSFESIYSCIIHPIIYPSLLFSFIYRIIIHLSICLCIYHATLLSTHLWLLICLQARQHIATVLSQFESERDHIASPYIPTFYQDCRAIHDCQQTEVSIKIKQLCSSCVYVTCFFFSFIQNPVMQQPLCHLYFFTLMEHLLTKPKSVHSLIRVAGNISQVYGNKYYIDMLLFFLLL